MNIGMLWFDNDPKAGLEIKVERAATYYRNKYGKSPTVCFVHPTMIPAAPEKVAVEGKREAVAMKAAGVEVRSNTSVLPNHIWIGIQQTRDAYGGLNGD